MKNQWNFGELFPVEQTRTVLTVGELTRQIKGLLEKQVGQVWVTGEVTNLRAQASGHQYFSLKDAASQLACVLFRTEKVIHREGLRDGQKVVLQGDLTVYEARGQYQLIVRAVELQGLGALQLAFERLKQKLAAEGLFAPERKRPLPHIIRRLGLVTSPTGAAIRDVMTIMQRRQPWMEIILAPCRVQGAGAADEVARALANLNRWHQQGGALDAILITRGGGSLEDLWAFNEEPVARAIHLSALPVVSAVGHEIDFTISDFVADFRAPTPSAAAEILTEGAFARRDLIQQAPAFLTEHCRDQIQVWRAGLDQWRQRAARAHPRRKLDEQAQRLDDWRDSLQRTFRHQWQNLHQHAGTLGQRFRRLRPSAQLRLRSACLAQILGQLREQARRRREKAAQRLATAEGRLRLLSPEHTLARGYSITTEAATGKVLREAAKIKPGQKIKTRLHTGEISSVAEP